MTKYKPLMLVLGLVSSAASRSFSSYLSSLLKTNPPENLPQSKRAKFSELGAPDASIVWGNCDDYEIVKPLGAGKYSRVFEGRRYADNRTVAIKVLKPTPFWKVKREISVLRCLAGGPHIVELIDTCSIKGGVHVLSLVSDSGQGDGSLDGGSSKQRQAAPNTYCLVLEHCGSSRVLEEAGHAPDLRRRRPAVGASAPTPSSPGESGGGGCGTQGVGALPSWLKPWGAAGSATEVAAAAAAPAESASASARATTRRVRRTAPLPEQEGLLKQQEQQQEQQQQQRGEGGGRWGARVRQLPARRLSHGDFPKWRPLTTSEVRWAVFQLLEALKFAHGMSPLGVMHRDVKPSNVLVAGRGVPGLTLTLVDFGLAEFHRPERRYVTRVASRFYKAPELLMGDASYGPSLDLWGVGCVLAGLVFRKEPFFRGKDNTDQLATIASVLGSQGLIAAAERHLRGGFKGLDPDLRRAITHGQQKMPRKKAGSIKNRGGEQRSGTKSSSSSSSRAAAAGGVRRFLLPPRRPWVPADFGQNGGVGHERRRSKENKGVTTNRKTEMKVPAVSSSSKPSEGGFGLEGGGGDNDAGGTVDHDDGDGGDGDGEEEEEEEEDGVESEEGERDFDPYAEVVGSTRLCCPDALDLMGKLLHPDRDQRPSATEALEHPYFDPIRPHAAKALARRKANQQEQ